MNPVGPRPVARHLASVVVALLLGGASSACSSDVGVAGSGGAGGGGEGGGTDAPTAGPGGGDGGGGEGDGGGGGEACTCDEGLVEVPPCEDAPGACQPKTCGDEVIGCREPVPCDTNACVSDNIAGRGCSDVGEECQTTDCHGTTAAKFLCTEEHLWTDWNDLYFTCGDETCTHGVEYCEDVSDAGANQVQRCLPIPEECSVEDFCPCAPAMEICPDASCATTGNGAWIVSCW